MTSFGENQHLLKEGTPSATATDNNVHAQDYDMESETGEAHEGMPSSVINSPTKLTSFPAATENYKNFVISPTEKEFNSSSDTYTSDGEAKNNESQSNSFERNFDMAENIEKSVSNEPLTLHKFHINTDFSFAGENPQTPLNQSTETLNNNQPTYPNSSPSKSIMKRVSNASPRKNVAFTNSNPEVHHYVDKSVTAEPEESPEDAAQFAHKWSELEKSSSSSDNESISSPPAPPPHTTHSFIMGQRSHDDLDSEMLNDIKLKHRRFSNLSLNEKLDIYLSKQNSGNDLDQHLDDLSKAAKYQTDSNIHHLSLDLQLNHVVENPLNSLSKNSEFQLKSGGSSQSSLQSLAYTNRTLPSNSDHTINKGVELNDGIKGFPDHLVQSLIPSTYDDEDALVIGQPQAKDDSDSEDEFHDSFNTTEKSILNLLSSAERPELDDVKSLKGEVKPLVKVPSIEKSSVKSETLPLNFEPEESKEVPIIKQEPQVKLEPDLIVKAQPESDDETFKDEIKVKLEPQDEPMIKPESQDELKVKPEHQDEIKVKPEPKDEIESDIEPQVKTEIQPRSRQVSGQDSDHSFKRVDSELINFKHEPIDSTPLDLGFIPKEEAEGAEISDDDANYSYDTDTHLESASLGKISESKELKLVRTESSLRKSDVSTSSNDGDNEDNEDTEMPSELHNIEHVPKEQVGEDVSRSSSSFEDASEELIGRTLAPPRVDEAIDATEPPSPVKKALLLKAQKEESITKDSEDDVLANSSNIAPPVEISLPAIEHLSSFDEVTEKMGIKDSFEESLSAEHEADPKPTNFISIWHSQNRTKKPSYEEPKMDIHVYEYKVPATLQAKKFKEVNVMSRRIVSPDFEELHVSGFLPEISEDSGFETKFKSLMKSENLSNISGNRNSMRPLSTKNVLSNIDSDPAVIEPPQPRPIERRPKGPDYAEVYRQQKQESKKSRFAVPSFEIKRTNSILSPRNQYNDIFSDTVAVPTIKAHGMKTLPSMDKDDVKKIMEAKRVISQDEYSRLKHLGVHKKKSIVDEPADKYDSLQQVASIHNVSMDSSFQDVMPHLASELMRNPTALSTKDQVFNDTTLYLNDSQAFIAQLENAEQNKSLLDPTKNFESFAFPDPDPELVNSPGHDSNSIFKTPPKSNPENDVIDEDLEMKYRIINNSPRKTPRKSPSKNANAIKIGLPIRLVKNGGAITGVALETKQKELKMKQDEFNQKLNELKLNPPGHQQEPSTVSVPTLRSDPSTASSATLFQGPQSRNLKTPEPEIPEVIPEIEQTPGHIAETDSAPQQERGRLFFRVIGFKNIDLPNINGQKAEFNISLDNGVHCIKTPNYKLDSLNVAVGKEFELTVGDSLEFIMTMKASYEKPRGRLVEIKERRVTKSKNRFSRLFGSKDIITTTKFVPQEVQDRWEHKVAQDGSFARCYIDLQQYEDQITGRACNFDLTCFNEWGVEPSPSGEPVNLQPYRIGQLEVRMLFIPKTEPNEILPTSIRSAYESIQEIQQEATFTHEGYLHQEGGDCDIWKRRFFKLQGTSLIAHSEFSHKTRAKINLAKVIDVIYVDKENIHNPASQNYRNFSDILLLEHAFKIRFANGEIIDFGAPNKEEKDAWISIFEKIVYRNKFRRQPWVKMMVSQA